MRAGAGVTVDRASAPTARRQKWSRTRCWQRHHGAVVTFSPCYSPTSWSSSFPLTHCYLSRQVLALLPVGQVPVLRTTAELHNGCAGWTDTMSPYASTRRESPRSAAPSAKESVVLDAICMLADHLVDPVDIVSLARCNHATLECLIPGMWRRINRFHHLEEVGAQLQRIAGRIRRDGSPMSEKVRSSTCFGFEPMSMWACSR
ncbi:hypothetical protein CALCODRAFT_237432 [Calocera cornea HHB12733]|uniref:Uncharacterized protein n=1 Tax=Calocera cornea HHB12733 TaxID=1353952 RepID=A0A165BZL8_9BASI|nr:hypothetical protein CALCODRAFT_237432 [Calocera cornea HHB12733]